MSSANAANGASTQSQPSQGATLHGPRADLTDALRRVQAAKGPERRDALQAAAPALRQYLADADSQGITGNTDDRLPGVNFHGSPSDMVRVITMDGGMEVGSLNRGYAYLQWWVDGRHHMLPLHEGQPYVVPDAAVLTGPDGRYLAMKISLVQPPWTQSVIVLKLTSIADKWDRHSTAFGALPARVGNAQVQSNGSTVTVQEKGPGAGDIFLKDSGKSLLICEHGGQCMTAKWDGRQYRF